LWGFNEQTTRTSRVKSELTKTSSDLQNITSDLLDLTSLQQLDHSLLHLSTR